MGGVEERAGLWGGAFEAVVHPWWAGPSVFGPMRGGAE